MPISENDLTLRLVKGSPLTAQEMDDNLRKLANFENALESYFSGIFNADGTLKDGAVDRTDVISDRIITAAKLGWLFNFYAVADGVNNYTAQIMPDTGFTYGDGLTTSFIASIKFTNANTSATCSLDVNGAGARNLTKQGGLPLAIGDIKAGFVAVVAFDGSNLQITNDLPPPPSQRTPGVGDGLVMLTNPTGNYNAAAGFTRFRVKAWGGGAGGFSRTGVGPGSTGGGGGEYAESIIVLNPLEVVPYIIGIAGTAGVFGSTTATNGGYTSFGADVVRANGGHFSGVSGSGGVGQLLIAGQRGGFGPLSDPSGWANGGGSFCSSQSNGESTPAGNGMFPGGGGGAFYGASGGDARDGAAGLIVVEPLD